LNIVFHHITTQYHNPEDHDLSIVIEFGMPKKVGRVIKMCVNEICSKSAQVNMCLIHVQNGLK